jgi:putative sterol carrier protein
MAAIAGTIAVRRAESADSGFASIVEQFLQQSLDESEVKRRRAARLRGRIAMTASDYEQSVTLVFGEGDVAILDGAVDPLDARIVGPYQTLVDLIQGDASPLMAHLRRRIRVRSRKRKLLFPLHVHNLMKLEKEEQPSGLFAGVRDSALAGAALVIAAALLFYAT